MSNRNEITGIRFGYIAADKLDGDVVHELMYGAGAVNLSEKEAEREEVARQEAEYDAKLEVYRESGVYVDVEPFEPDLNTFESQVDEPTVEGVYEGVSYCSSWLGGALNFFITESPHTGEFVACSPCAPGAADLGNPQPGGVVGYNVPPEWRWKEV
jgi:hypothetical protein